MRESQSICHKFKNDRADKETTTVTSLQALSMNSHSCARDVKLYNIKQVD